MRSKIAPKPTSPISFSSCSTKIPKIGQTLPCKFVLSGTGLSTKFLRSQSLNKPVPNRQIIKKISCTANFDGFYEKHLSEEIEGFSQTFDLLDERENQEYTNNKPICTIPQSRDRSIVTSSILPSRFEIFEPSVFGIMPEPPLKWPERESVMRVSIELKVNSVDLPFSIRMIRKKQKKLQEGFNSWGLGDSACGSVNKAFSSMVFIILELQKFYTLQMREAQHYDHLKGSVTQVDRDIHESFAWLFQQIFSQTPNLMVYVMVLLADFSVHSMSNNIDIQNQELHGISASCEMTERVSMNESQRRQEPQYDSFGDSYLGGSSLSVQYPNDISLFSSDEDRKINEDEVGLWNFMVDEAMRIQMEQRDVVLDHETMQSLTSAVNVEIESDEKTDYYRTNLLYQMGLSEEPNNPLLLCNYAQFLFLIARDYDRAEECFKRSIQVEPLDAESLSQYATFLWIVRKDLWGAEERYIQAIAAEPENPYHASKYANFLWSTGGEETCYPLDTSYDNTKAQNY